MEVFLYNSTVCRLCGEENDNGTFLYSTEENNQNISELVNAFLPIRVRDDGQLPRTICPGCTIQLEAAVEFITLIANGQKVIRALHQREIEYKKTVLNTVENEAEVATEINIEDGAYPPEHRMSLQVAGLDKPKRKRGRPPKKPKTPEELAMEAAAKENQEKAANEVKHDEEITGKRKRKAPTRFQEVVQGKELEKIFIEEGVTDGEESEPDIKPDIAPAAAENTPKVPEIIGHTDSGELVIIVKGKGRGRPKGRLHQKSQKCAICDKEFLCSGRYMSHIAQHGPVMYQCQQCTETFPTRLDFTAHQEETEHKGQTVIPCKDKDGEISENHPLNEKSSSTDKVDEVSTQPLPDLNEKTEVVEKTVELKVEMDPENNSENENKVKSEEEPAESTTQGRKKLKCPHCDKLFSSKQSRSVHVKAIHRGERAYRCVTCDATFAYPRALYVHALTHRTLHSKGYACDLCGKVLNHPSSVTYHKEAEHAGHKFVCNKCGKTFKHKQLLQRHQLVHTQHRPFHCKVCNAAFKTKANLFNHQLLHSGVKKHVCDICKQRFAHKTSLTLHMRWHSGQKPYVCKECGKAFSQKGNLSEHSRIHTGEKPFHCAHCPRRFTTSSQHRLHLRRHATDRDTSNDPLRIARSTAISRAAAAAAAPAPSPAPAPPPPRQAAGAAVPAAPAAPAGGEHKCSYCGRVCPSRWALVKHTRKHTGERPFKCPLCPRAFADCSNLNKHKKHIHKQVSLLANQVELVRPISASDESRADAAEFVVESEQDNMDESVIYVTYDMEDGQSPSYTLVQQDQEVEQFQSEPSSPQPYSRVFVQPKLAAARDLAAPDHMCVTDDQGNPLHFTMQDGTQLAITSLDGQSLQVITQDGQTIPVEINGFSPEPVQQISEEPSTIVHQLSIQKTEEDEPTSPVTHYYTIV